MLNVLKYLHGSECCTIFVSQTNKTKTKMKVQILTIKAGYSNQDGTTSIGFIACVNSKKIAFGAEVSTITGKVEIIYDLRILNSGVKVTTLELIEVRNELRDKFIF